jgi:hypothetical protein
LKGQWKTALFEPQPSLEDTAKLHAGFHFFGFRNNNLFANLSVGRSVGYIAAGCRQHSHSWLQVSWRLLTKILFLS